MTSRCLPCIPGRPGPERRPPRSGSGPCRGQRRLPRPPRSGRCWRRQDDSAGAEPAARADRYRGVARPLAPDRHLRIGIAVVLVSDVDIRAGEDVSADHDRLMRHDVAAAPDHAPVADPQQRAFPQVLAGHHPGAEGNLCADHGLVTDLDPGFAEDGTGRECDQRPVAEGREPAAGRESAVIEPGLLHGPPGLVDKPGEGSTIPIAEHNLPADHDRASRRPDPSPRAGRTLRRSACRGYRGPSREPRWRPALPRTRACRPAVTPSTAILAWDSAESG